MMKRRDFLKLLGLVLAGGEVRIASGSNGKKGRRVLVIGAGLSGLAAARELRRKGYEVVVLDARERIGGRIWTSKQWPEMPLDLGATWIHGVRGNPITKLADEIHAARIVTSYEKSVLYSTRGQVLSEGEEARMERLSKRAFRLLREAQNAEEDRSVLQAVEPLLKECAASAQDTRFLQYILNSHIEQEYAGSLSRLSAHWYDSDEGFEGEDALFAKGFEVVTDFLAEGSQIELGQEVTEIHWRAPEVRVVTRKGEFFADQVVVTLPLGVLQGGRVRFVPELPEEKRDAIGGIGMGVLNKCYLRFDEVFWPRAADWLGYVSARPGEWTEWVSFKRAANFPVLLGFNAASRGRKIEAFSDEKIVGGAMETLKVIYGPRIPAPTGFQITRWAADPFAAGSYSYNAVGATPDARVELAKSLNGKLFFAGEATQKEHFATAHGAYFSGVRAARNIAAK